MKKARFTLLMAGVAVLAIVGVVTLASADRGGGRGGNNFKAELEGFQEVPAISSTGSGEFRAEISRDESSFDFELSYEDLEGTSPVFAHIPLGQEAVNGGISVFLCGGGGRPACTTTSGTFTGTATASDVIGPAGQGLAPGEFDELLRAMREGVTYANVHTNKHPGGEIRGQIVIA